MGACVRAICSQANLLAAERTATRLLQRLPASLKGHSPRGTSWSSDQVGCFASIKPVPSHLCSETRLRRSILAKATHGTSGGGRHRRCQHTSPKVPFATTSTHADRSGSGRQSDRYGVWKAKVSLGDYLAALLRHADVHPGSMAPQLVPWRPLQSGVSTAG